MQLQRVVSRAKAQAAIKEGMVTINGSTTVKPGAILKAGDVVVVMELPEPPPLLVRLQDPQHSSQSNF